MRILKLILLGLLIFSAVVCGISFILPSGIRISRTIRIDAGKDSVMKEFIDPLKWKEWYPGADTAGIFYESGSIKGLVLKEHPRLSLVISEIHENEVLTTYIKTSSSPTMHSIWRTIPETSLNHVTIQWYLDLHFRWYPWEKFSSLMYDKLYGALMDRGLDNLKKRIEVR
ncbi:MAG: SRPBCC family protein [Bacteroidetes bacterium]|nr:SRPBCC family protein [Bacteroidota bacterium]MBS1931338.1 SRPBCC family protein [Bacteroidota bacterium]